MEHISPPASCRPQASDGLTRKACVDYKIKIKVDKSTNLIVLSSVETAFLLVFLIYRVLFFTLLSVLSTMFSPSNISACSATSALLAYLIV